jgi:hypothetical protein
MPHFEGHFPGFIAAVQVVRTIWKPYKELYGDVKIHLEAAHGTRVVLILEVPPVRDYVFLHPEEELEPLISHVIQRILKGLDRD